MAGAPRGTLSERRTVTSTIYDGAEVAYWIYANPGIDPAGTPLTIWLDGQGFVAARDLVNDRLQIVSDNLVHLGRLAPMVHLFVAPGTGGKPLPPRFPGGTRDNAVRGLQYDQVSDRYGRLLLRRHLRLCLIPGFDDAILSHERLVVANVKEAWDQRAPSAGNITR